MRRDQSWSCRQRTSVRADDVQRSWLHVWPSPRRVWRTARVRNLHGSANLWWRGRFQSVWAPPWGHSRWREGAALHSDDLHSSRLHVRRGVGRMRGTARLRHVRGSRGVWARRVRQVRAARGCPPGRWVFGHVHARDVHVAGVHMRLREQRLWRSPSMRLVFGPGDVRRSRWLRPVWPASRDRCRRRRRGMCAAGLRQLVHQLWSRWGRLRECHSVRDVQGARPNMRWRRNAWSVRVHWALQPTGGV